MAFRQMSTARYGVGIKSMIDGQEHSVPSHLPPILRSLHRPSTLPPPPRPKPRDPCPARILKLPGPTLDRQLYALAQALLDALLFFLIQRHVRLPHRPRIISDATPRIQHLKRQMRILPLREIGRIETSKAPGEFVKAGKLDALESRPLGLLVGEHRQDVLVEERPQCGAATLAEGVRAVGTPEPRPLGAVLFEDERAQRRPHGPDKGGPFLVARVVKRESFPVLPWGVGADLEVRQLVATVGERAEVVVHRTGEGGASDMILGVLVHAMDDVV